MEEHIIEIEWEGKSFRLEIRDYVHHDDRCKFEIYLDNKSVASFEPDSCRNLHVCKNTGNIPEEALYIIAEEIESRPWW